MTISTNNQLSKFSLSSSKTLPLEEETQSKKPKKTKIHKINEQKTLKIDSSEKISNEAKNLFSRESCEFKNENELTAPKRKKDLFFSSPSTLKLFEGKEDSLQRFTSKSRNKELVRVKFASKYPAALHNEIQNPEDSLVDLKSMELIFIEQVKLLQSTLTKLDNDSDIDFKSLSELTELQQSIIENRMYFSRLDRFSKKASKPSKEFCDLFDKSCEDTQSFKNKFNSWSQKKIAHIEEQTNEVGDEALKKIIEVAKSMQSELNVFEKIHQRQTNNTSFAYNKSSCGLTSWAIGKKLSQLDGEQLLSIIRVRDLSTKSLRSQLNKGKESLFLCIISFGRGALDEAHEFVIHEKYINGTYKYRIYFSYAKYFELEHTLSVQDFNSENRGWMSYDELSPLLDCIDQLMNRKIALTSAMLEKYSDYFGTSEWHLEGAVLKDSNFSYLALRNQNGRFIPQRINLQKEFVFTIIIICLLAHIFFSKSDSGVLP